MRGRDLRRDPNEGEISNMMKCVVSAIALVLAGFALPSAAGAFVAWDDGSDVQWQGPGYYAVDYAGVGMDLIFDEPGRTEISAGAFASKAACQAAIARYVKPKFRKDYGCEYIPTKKKFDDGN